MDGKKLLAEYIARTGKPQAEFARQVGCSEGHLSSILSGARGVSPKLAKRISDVTENNVPFEAMLIEIECREAAP